MTVPSFLLLLAMSSPSTTMHREFRFVPYGSSFSEGDRPTVSCDGRIPGGVTLELTHWTDNETPDTLYADTSTEMAIQFAKQQDAYQHLDNALILNNHYDTDGVLSVWACLHPFPALQYQELLKEGAEAGDFGEWSSDRGVKLDCAITSFVEDNDEEVAYNKVLEELPSVLEDLETDGTAYKHLWNDGFQAAVYDWEAFQEGSASLERGPGKLVLLKEPRRLSPYALHRGLREAGLTTGTTRILRCLESEPSLFQYRYEMPGYGWVKKLVDRPVIPSVDALELIKQLPKGWAPSGGLVGICHSTAASTMPPEAVANLLHRSDPGCQ